MFGRQHVRVGDLLKIIKTKNEQSNCCKENFFLFRFGAAMNNDILEWLAKRRHIRKKGSAAFIARNNASRINFTTVSDCTVKIEKKNRKGTIINLF